jgi:nucleoside-diphosphate-sugar epimerase
MASSAATLPPAAPRVLVTGVSGFIGSWVAAALLQLGYRVRGTVRSLARKPELDGLISGPHHELELVQADLTDPSVWPAAVADCDYVLHVASPYFLRNPKDAEAELYRPAVEGTLNVLRAASEAARPPKRVVVTSSIAAMVNGHSDTRDPAEPFTDDSWSNPDGPSVKAYSRSKTLAERAAWKFVSELPEVKRFELATVNPSGVMGPFLNSSDSGSGELVSTMLGGKMPMIANVGLPLVDIRDVVQAHIAAMTVPEAAGKRFAVNPIAAMMPDAARIYREAFAPYGYHVPSLVAPKPLLWLASWFDDTAGIAFTIADRPPATNDNENARTVLGLPLITDPEPCLLAMGFSMIQHGMLPDKSEGHVLTRALRPDTSGSELPPQVADVREAMRAVMAPFAMSRVVQGLRRADGSVFGADTDLPGRVGVVSGVGVSSAAAKGR